MLKSIMIALMLFSVSLFAGTYDIDNHVFTDNGWEKPFKRTLATHTNYDYESQVYFTNHGIWHGAVDIIATLDEQVYSIADGEVVKFYKKTGSTQNMSVVYIKYKSADGTEFLVIYGHVYAKNDLYDGYRVKKGEYIGNIKRYGSPDHLHFGITLNLNYHGESFGSSNSWTGVVDPLEFLQEHVNIVTEGIFDGAGSIINPSVTGDGSNQDIAAMHSHNPYNSTVVFQWKDRESNVCEYLDIYTLYGDHLGDVTVTTRPWNGAFPDTQNQQIFEVTLDGEPFSIAKANNSTGWTLISITSKNPLTKDNVFIRAECSTNSFKTKSRNYLYQDDSSQSDKKLVSVTHGYWWAGNSSIISYKDTNEYEYGINHDSMLSYNTHDSFIALQWYTKDKCQKLKIGVQRNWNISDETAYVEEVKIKPWSSKEWDSEPMCNGQLPCTITSPKVSNDGHSIDFNNYYIVKIKLKAGAIPLNDSNTRYVKAVCVD